LLIKKYSINKEIENQNDRNKYIGKIFISKIFGEYKVLGVYDTNGSKTGNKRYVVEFKNTGFQTISTGIQIINKNIKDSLKPIIYNKGYYGYVKNVKHNPYINKWVSMLQRCYDEKFHIKEETYKDCIVNEKWLCFEYFLQDIPKILGYQDMIDHQNIKFELDKDVLTDAKIYNLENCVFVPGKINNFFTNIQKHNTSGYPGVSYDKTKEKYACYISNNSNQEHLGYFNDPLDAFMEYFKHKKLILEKYLEEYNFLHIKIKNGCRDKLRRQYESILNYNLKSDIK